VTIALDIVNAIADICNDAELPPHNTVRHRRPVIVLPQDCPLLVVWFQASQYAPRTTERYDRTVTVGVSWQQSAIEQVRTLQFDENLAKGLADNIGMIEQRLIAYAVRSDPLPDVPQVYEMFPAGTTYSPGPELETGLVEGYIVTVQLNMVDIAEDI
jgi:hypothetical protein